MIAAAFNAALKLSGPISIHDDFFLDLGGDSLAAVGVTDGTFEIGSTDANIPLSRGLPCVCVGLARGANSHRPDEYIETRDIDRGLESIVRMVKGAFDL